MKEICGTILNRKDSPVSQQTGIPDITTHVPTNQRKKKSQKLGQEQFGSLIDSLSWHLKWTNNLHINVDLVTSVEGKWELTEQLASIMKAWI